MTNAEKFVEIMNETFNARMTKKNLEMSCSPCGMLKKHEYACKIFDCDKCQAWWGKEWKPKNADITRVLPQRGETWRHFKGKDYIILAVAEHSETGAKFVIYRRFNVAVTPQLKIYARPLEMFMSEVDRKKYPDAPQKYRFERLD